MKKHSPSSRPFRPKARRTALSLLGAVILILWIWQLYTFWNENDRRILSRRSTISDTVILDYFDHYESGVSLRYIRLGNPNGEKLFLLHGTPGSINTWETFLSETSALDDYLVYVIDRPGFGRSAPFSSFPHIQEQSVIIGDFIEDINSQSNLSGAILLGHSFAGSLLPQLALDYSSIITGMVIVSGTTDPESQTIWWTNHLSRFFLTRLLLPPILNHTNDEKIMSISELAGLSSQRGEITTATILLHSRDDVLVDYENALFADRMLRSSPHVLMSDDDVNHFYPFSATERLYEALLRLNDFIPSPANIGLN